MQSSSDVRITQLRSQLSHYLSRGWALTPLHDVSSGTCSCRLGAACRSAGKHPRREEWQRPENLVRDETGLDAALQRWPSSNWGLATGLISQAPVGLWALDYDPAHVEAAQAVEVQALLEACWATGTWVQRTGSGGLHFLFALPEDFVPNNGSGSLPAGFDVRGARRGEVTGGQIVIAPSVTDKGAYTVLADRPVTAAPAALLQAVRPAPPRTVGAVPLQLATRDQDAVTRYVVAAVAGELQALRECWTARNQRAWRAAARCIELVNTGLIGGEAVYAAWWEAGLAHPDRAVTVPDVELLRVWASAERHVGDRPADLSGVGGPRGWGGDPIHFAAAPAAPPSLGGGPAGANGSGAAGSGSYPQGVAGAVDNAVTRGADTALTPADGSTDPVDPVSALIARMLTPEQLDERPNPEPLINGVLDLSSAAWLIGASGSFKSFVALDLAAHVGLGREWRGHAVRQGLVVYVVAEGDRGMKLRQAAWRREYGPLKDVLFLPEPVQADERRAPRDTGGAWTVLVEACRRLMPVLVIIDTQARVTIGLDENSNGDMSYYAEQADRIKRATGACVLTVHHIGRKGVDARGASAIDGAQDAELKVVREGMTLTLSFEKTKDAAEAPPVAILVRRSEGGTDEHTGRDLSSLVLDVGEVPLPGVDDEPGMPRWKRQALALFKIMHERFGRGGDGETKSNIGKLFRALPEIVELSPSAQSTAFYEAWNELQRRGRMMRFGTTARYAAFLPPDGASDGWLTINTEQPDDSPPAGWGLHWPEADRERARAARESGKPRLMGA